MNVFSKYHLKNFLAGLLVLMLSFSSNGQNVKVTAKLDNTEIKIGQEVKLNLNIEYRVDNGTEMNIIWPEFTDTLRKEIEILNVSKIDTIVDKNDPYKFTQSRTINITSFDSGYWAIPPFRFYLNNDTNAILTEPLLLQVNTISVDTTLAIKDIKPPYSQEYTWLDWIKDHMNYVWISLAAIVVILILIYVFIKVGRIKPPMVIIEEPKIPAHVIALEKLDLLQNEKLWQQGKLKQYHSSLTDIVREYIENRFKIQALEQTTDEILFGLRNVAIDDESKTKLKQTLVLADLVKFAKEQPMQNENELSMSNTYDFINGTKREEEYKAEDKRPKFVNP